MEEQNDSELIKVIGDFLEMGHVENIVAMFRRDPYYYKMTGDILNDERFNVRLGISVLFEELQKIQPKMTGLAVPSLVKLLKSAPPHVRGEAVSVLGIIANSKALAAIRPLVDDQDNQVAEIVRDILRENQ